MNRTMGTFTRTMATPLAFACTVLVTGTVQASEDDVRKQMEAWRRSCRSPGVRACSAEAVAAGGAESAEGAGWARTGRARAVIMAAAAIRLWKKDMVRVLIKGLVRWNDRFSG